MGEPSRPVPANERKTSIDVLRGCALCGILTMNILSMGLPGTARLNPYVAGGFSGLNYGAWLVGYFLFDEKMITVFSMLFGAGLVLLTERTAPTGRSSAAVYYRRVGILLVIGLVHAYLIWDGDILVSYALCGMLVYPARKFAPRTLIVLGLLVMLPAIPLTRSVGRLFESMRLASARVDEATERGATVADDDRELAAGWDEIRKAFHPTPTEVAEQIAEHRRATYRDLVVRNAPQALSVQTTVFVSAFLWTVSGRMLIGMALMKLGVFTAARTGSFYRWLAVLGYGLGWPIVAIAAVRLINHQFDVVELFGSGLLVNLGGSLLVALGHIAVVMLVVQAELCPFLTTRLAAVGRMALTNYLLQSLLCTTFFNSYGGGYYGACDRLQLYGLVVAVWLLQLTYSPLWLRYFRFGPVEWLWRSLTYGAWQPLKV